MKSYREYYWIGWSVIFFFALVIMFIMDFERTLHPDFMGWYSFFDGIMIFAFGGLIASNLK